MKKIAQINSVCGKGSTGIIAMHLNEIAQLNGFDSKVFFGYGQSPCASSVRLSSKLYVKLNILKTRLFGKHAFYSKLATKKLVRLLKEYKPDLIHIHQIHGHYLNIPILFDFLTEYNVPIVITMHDCWMFTGHCVHFETCGCDKWKTGCHDCPQLKTYPVSYFFDRSKESWNDKKKYFNMTNKLHLVTPSKWLSNYVGKSFLNKHDCSVIHNGIDTSDFVKVDVSNLKEELDLNDKFIILGMAEKWLYNENEPHSLEFLSKLNTNIKVILIGVKEGTNYLPDNVIKVPYLNDKNKLIEYYNLADVFINLTLADNFPTVNIESISCGTPVITFDTGGSAEIIDETTGIKVSKGDFDALNTALKTLMDNKIKYNKQCRNRALEMFDKNTCYDKYISLYNKLLGES